MFSKRIYTDMFSFRYHIVDSILNDTWAEREPESECARVLNGSNNGATGDRCRRLCAALFTALQQLDVAAWSWQFGVGGNSDGRRYDLGIQANPLREPTPSFAQDGC